ncbi:uncharacterized protein LOC106167944 [Lingula anatina]|uniref:Uncharacterized protein LOC106167944 n=1 Tax=Lingula anatina TaxID=7574 RepID=A0A1S3IVT3_LINAN|nr:uncharacterized protein LOC106167944 [Lingula anatina]|eukprot:XP_013402305.1 uncharacterized protein LOC106167944 [Lingula anatina]
MILFFVIDSKTRSITSVVEAAYLAGSGRQMVLVITGEPEEPAYSKSKMGRNSSIKEFEDLDYSRSILQYLADKQGVPVFSVVKDALDCANILTKWTQELVGPGRRMRHGCTFTDLGAIECSIRAIKQAFELCDKQNSGTLDFKGVTRAFKQVTKEVLSTDLVSAIIKNVSSKRFTLDEFCCLFTEFKHWRRKESLNEQNGLMKVFSPSRWFKQPCMAPRTFSCDASTMHYVPASVVDVYVAGSCGTNNWRNTIVLPLFREKGMTYLCSETLSERDTIEKNRCRLLLYVIEDNTMGTVDMMEIGYDIGQGYNLILSIENMAQDSVVQGISLSRGAVKDYNRSRMYLADLAAREGIPVFSSIEEAAKHAVEKVQFLREHPSPRPGLERARSCED